jgi:cardiolipin synthase A/B
MLFSLLYIIYSLIVIALIVHLLLSGVRPTKTLAWMIVIALLPVAGIVFYLTFGLNRRKHKFIQLKKGRALNHYIRQRDQLYHSIELENASEAQSVKRHRKLAKMIENSSGFLPHGGNRTALLENGPDTFEAIFRAVEKARHYIHIQYYILEEGELLEQLAARLEQKAKEGVEVRIIYDGVGSNRLSRRFLGRLRASGVEIYGFLPLRFKHFTTTVNYRNHRKVVVVDGIIGFTGGINISDKYWKGDPDLGRWQDMHLQLEGPVVNSLQAVFAVDWQFVSGQEALLETPYFPEQPARGATCVQVVTSGPDSDFPAVRQEYFTLINQASSYVYITNPYVIPGSIILEALQTAALGGIDTRLMIPANSDNHIVRWSVRSYFQELLEAGVQIFLYPHGFLHSKVMVCDGTVASIGTANLDTRSFEQNFEINAVLYDTNIARHLGQKFLADCDISEKLDKEAFRQRPLSDKFKEGAAKILSPLL